MLLPYGVSVLVHKPSTLVCDLACIMADHKGGGASTRSGKVATLLSATPLLVDGAELA